jgi:hypothetical protein
MVLIKKEEGKENDRFKTKKATRRLKSLAAIALSSELQLE